ncbi:MAG: hypothetical protein J4O08_04255 [Chloroflexi bacterium]|nr:hypothetical protein [Chloroflexota bacterium]
MIPLTIFAHHSEPGDPVLLGWIKDQIDAVLGFGPETIVIGLGLVVIAMPVAIMAVYLTQRAKHGGP